MAEKNNVIKTFNSSQSQLERLQQYADEHDISVAEAIRQAVERLLEDNEHAA